MEAFEASYKLSFVFLGKRNNDISQVFSTFQTKVDISLLRVNNRADRQTPDVVGDPDSHISLALDHTIRTEDLRFYTKTPLLPEDRLLSLACGDADRDVVNKS